jgi:hypothetical protein
MPTASSRTTGSPSSWPGAELPAALRALLETGWSLAGRAPSARVALARAAGLVDPEALPKAIREPVVRELEAARAAAYEPLDPRIVERALPPNALDDFDPEPLAVRAAAQTHRGVAGGRPVAIRVRRPGLARAVRNDLALLDAIAPVLGAALPNADTRPLLRAVREQVLDELDFEHEASTHRRVARALRGVEGLVVPRALGELCAEHIFVAELLDGETLADGARPADVEAATRALLEAHVRAARAGLALLDARPGHVVVLGDGSVGLLGAGVARAVDRGRVERALAAAAALRASDPEGFAAAIDDLAPHAAAYALARSALGALADGHARLDTGALRAAAEAAPEGFDLASELRPRPDDLWLGRAAGQLAATLATLGAEHDWLALVASSTRR